MENGEQTDVDDNSWRLVDLPHDFQVEQAWLTPDSWGEGTENEDETLKKRLMARGFKEMETGWYRKSFVSDTSWKGRRVIIDFEGIMLVGDVWLNGKKSEKPITVTAVSK